MWISAVGLELGRKGFFIRYTSEYVVLINRSFDGFNQCVERSFNTVFEKAY